MTQVVLALVLSGADNVGNAWSIIWLSFITLYLINILVLVVSTGIDRSDRILLVSLAEPAALIAAFYALVVDALAPAPVDENW